MSDDDQSAIDALVDEAVSGRETAEAAKAGGASGSQIYDHTLEDDESQEPKVNLGYADNTDSAQAGSAVDGAEAEGDVAALRAERDSYLADSQRLAADFANFRKQSEKRVSEAAASQSAGLVRDLIPVLDACDSALVQDPESAAGPIRSALITELEKNGLELLAPVDGAPFDPEMHEAVMHDPGSGETDGPVVAEILRAGYLWKGRVVRPAMVKVVG